MKHILTLTMAAAMAHTSSAAFFADQIVSYTPGTGVEHSTQTSALGAPSSMVGSEYPNVLSPFSPAYEGDELLQIGQGGQLTLRLSNFVIIDRTPGVREIGIWENVGLQDSNFMDSVAQTTSPATVFGADAAIVEVSEDNVTWYSLNNGLPILFTLPGNYYLNAGAFDMTPPTNPQIADFGKPFAGSLSDFNGMTNAQVLEALGGSGGGTWLDLDAVPVSKVGYIRFRDVVQDPETSTIETLDIDAVAINSKLAGSAVPEPASGLLALMGVAWVGAFRRKRV